MKQLNTSNIILGFSFLLLFDSCNNQPNNQLLTKAFVCNEYWTMQKIHWEKAFDDVKFCQNEMIIKSKDSIWGVIYPGSLTLSKDTIYVNQENAFNNICNQIGKVKVGGRVLVERFKNIEVFYRVNDTLIEFAGNQFVKSKLPVISGCWCDWE